MRQSVGLVLLISAILRFWGIWENSFQYDELSAIFRARAVSWFEHWNFGILPDGHPPGVQTFLWIWLKVIGKNPVPLHIFCALLSTLAVYFVYRAALNLVGRQAALLAIILYGFSYLPLSWSQQIRPYSFGMFFSTGLIWLWSSIIQNENKQQKGKFIVFGIIAGVCSYIHYFSALLAGLLWLHAFLTNRIQFKNLLISAGIGILVFLPSLPVFVHQFHGGGLDWLGKPTVSFLSDHLKQLFNVNPLLIVISIVITLLLGPIPSKKTALTLLLLFFIPLIVGFAWSLTVKPVLQHSVLVFSAPFIFIFCGSIFSNPKLWFFPYLWAFVTLFALVKSEFLTKTNVCGYQKQSANMAETFRRDTSTTILADGPDDIIAYHLQRSKSPKQPSFISNRTTPFSYARLWSLCSSAVKSRKPIELALNSGSHPGIIPLLEHWTGKAAFRRSWIGAEYLTFNPSNREQNKISYAKLQLDASGKIEIQLKKLNFQKNDVLVVQIPDTTISDSLMLVSELLNDGNQFDFRSSKKVDFKQVGDGSLFLFIKTADIREVKENTTLKVHIENISIKKGIEIAIRCSKSNPYIYGLPCF
jgi:hypothetical protein